MGNSGAFTRGKAKTQVYPSTDFFLDQSSGLTNENDNKILKKESILSKLTNVDFLKDVKEFDCLEEEKYFVENNSANLARSLRKAKKNGKKIKKKHFKILFFLKKKKKKKKIFFVFF